MSASAPVTLSFCVAAEAFAGFVGRLRKTATPRLPQQVGGFLRSGSPPSLSRRFAGSRASRLRQGYGGQAARRVDPKGKDLLRATRNPAAPARVQAGMKHAAWTLLLAALSALDQQAPRPPLERVQPIDKDAKVVLHEWGVVAGVAGDGFAITDAGLPAGIPDFMTAIRGSSVGMMTARQPVIHVYSDRPTGFSLKVGVPSGWPVVADPRPTSWNAWGDGSQGKQDRHVAWQGAIMPGAPATGPAVAAGHWLEKIRAVDASTLKVSGRAEKYLFYEAALSLKHAVTLTIRDGAVAASGPIPANAVAIRVRDGKAEQPPGPGLAERIRATGLKEAEMKALLGIWEGELLRRDGLRLVTVLTGAEVDALLPLDFCPRPREVVRVLIVSVDFATPELEAKIAALAEALDSESLETRDTASRELRMLGPIARSPIAALAAASEGERKVRLEWILSKLGPVLAPPPPEPVRRGPPPLPSPH